MRTLLFALALFSATAQAQEAPPPDPYVVLTPEKVVPDGWSVVRVDTTPEPMGLRAVFTYRRPDGRDGHITRDLCHTPCQVAVVPGNTRFIVARPGWDAAGLSGNLEANSVYTLHGSMRPRSRLVTGIVSTSVGGALTLIGLFVTAWGDIWDEPGLRNTGIGMMAVGGVGIGVGVANLATSSSKLEPQ